MSVRLTLLSAAAPVERDIRFGDTPLDEAALRAARALPASLRTAAVLYVAPSQRCHQTAQALGAREFTEEPALRDLDTGRWEGRSPAEIVAADQAAFAAWMTDPEAAPHGGESVADLCRRVAAWLEGMPDDVGRVVAVVEQAVARAAVLHALAAPVGSFWRVDVPPLAAVRLTGRSGRWNLRLETLAAARDDEAVSGV